MPASLVFTHHQIEDFERRMSFEPPVKDDPQPTPGSKLRARALLIGLGLLVLAYAAALIVKP
jgi:hypothetical protein